MQLFTGPFSMFGAKAEIAVREKGLSFEQVMVPLASQGRPVPRFLPSHLAP